MIKMKSKKEIEIMQEGGSKLASISKRLKKKASVGVTTESLNKLAQKLMKEEGGKPSFLGYKGFPAAICTSTNETVVHGVPSNQKLKEGDILSIDIGFEWKGYHTDMAFTFPIGSVGSEAEKLIRVTEESLNLAIKKSKSGVRLGDIGHAVEECVKKAGFVVVEGLCGHGIGKEVHEDPQVMNTGMPGRGIKLKDGFVFCIEPMVTTGSPKIEHTREGIKTKNLSAHFEHTIAVVDGKTEILTK